MSTSNTEVKSEKMMNFEKRELTISNTRLDFLLKV